ncbi:MAG: hypothetical protein IKN50_06560, partial [Clostridia bacterium]|nr:hypothetical protein [Clostridia bacterium]
IKKGSNSIVFMNDRMVRKSLEKLGESFSDARDYSVVGCYECGGREESSVRNPAASSSSFANVYSAPPSDIATLSANSERQTSHISVTDPYSRMRSNCSRSVYFSKRLRVSKSISIVVIPLYANSFSCSSLSRTARAISSIWAKVGRSP